jgi:hypothetical protein
MRGIGFFIPWEYLAGNAGQGGEVDRGEVYLAKSNEIVSGAL